MSSHQMGSIIICGRSAFEGPVGPVSRLKAARLVRLVGREPYRAKLAFSASSHLLTFLKKAAGESTSSFLPTVAPADTARQR